MNLIENTQKGQQTLVMEPNMTLPKSIEIFIVEPRILRLQINMNHFQSLASPKRKDLDSGREDKK